MWLELDDERRGALRCLPTSLDLALSDDVDAVRNIAAIAVGLLLVVGAIFNATNTGKHADEFSRGFAEGAWCFPPLRPSTPA